MRRSDPGGAVIRVGFAGLGILYSLMAYGAHNLEYAEMHLHCYAGYTTTWK